MPLISLTLVNLGTCLGLVTMIVITALVDSFLLVMDENKYSY